MIIMYNLISFWNLGFLEKMGELLSILLPILEVGLAVFFGLEIFMLPFPGGFKVFLVLICMVFALHGLSNLCEIIEDLIS